MGRRLTKSLVVAGVLCASWSVVALADCYCNVSEPVDVIVKNWQTFRPKVTAMHSLNAKLALDGKEVFYIPILSELPDVRQKMFKCQDYTGTQKSFAAIYGGYFDNECYQALVRKEDGTYTKTPQVVQKYGSSSVRELQVLGYDFLLTRESIDNISIGESSVSADYQCSVLDLNTANIDLGTAIMDIYKAIGQPKFDIRYMFTSDESLTIESSPIQQEIHLQLAADNPIDISDGAGYVWASRTNPNLYWIQATRDGVVFDAEELSSIDANVSYTVSGAASTMSQTLTLSEFCTYAYTLMNIYGEPTMTQSEKSILLQLYGASVPYKTVDSYAVEAVENFIAKGIISPDDDSSYLNWNAPINAKYFLTLLMRIADVDSRMVYKDVQITLDASLIDKNYYAAKVALDTSAVYDIKEDPTLPQVTTYVDVYVPAEELSSVYGSNYTTRMEAYAPSHLMVKARDGTLYPLSESVVVTSNGAKLARNATGDDSILPVTPFAECRGFQDVDGKQMLRIDVVRFDVPDLQSGNGYELQMVLPDGSVSGSVYVSPQGVNNMSESESWAGEEELAISSLKSCIITIRAGMEQSVTISSISGGSSRTLAEVMNDTSRKRGDFNYFSTEQDIGFRYIGTSDSESTYQVCNVQSKEALQGRLRSTDEVSYVEGFCQRDNELLVSSKWLQDMYFITEAPQMAGNSLYLKTKYNEIYLDRERRLIVAGNTVYRMQNCSAEEIYYLDGSGNYYVNFRAVFGWTGDFLIFKDSGSGIITVSIKKDSDKYRNVDSSAMNVQMFHNLRDVANLSMYVQGSSDRAMLNPQYGYYQMMMTTTYPLANWFIYMNQNFTGTQGTDNDWLFVFKPKTVNVNGTEKVVDDSRSRAQLSAVLGDLKLTSDISVWAYRLNKISTGDNPDGFTFSDDYGWTYKIPKITSVGEMVNSYFDDTYTVGGSNTSAQSRCRFILPLFVDSENNLQCFNYNSYKSSTGWYPYGTIPGGDLVSRTGSLAKIIVNSVTAKEQYVRRLYELHNDGLLKENPAGGAEGYTVYPTVTCPAMWCVDMNEESYDEIISGGSGSIRIFYGTSEWKVTKSSSGDFACYQGLLKVDDEKVKNAKYLRIRNGYSTGSYERLYSISQLESFTLNSSDEGGKDLVEVVEEPRIGLASKFVSFVDWDEFTISRLLEDCEFAVAIMMVIALFIIPRVCLFAFLMLLGLGSIQNVKLVQWFCDRWFDPYKFLTFGRRDVHTFRTGLAFRNSLIAMAVFGLFTDGLIIHLYEWVIQLLAYVFGS